MVNIAVIYKSISGFTEAYTKWLSEELKCDIFRANEINENLLSKYDTIIYGGCLHAVVIYGWKKVRRILNQISPKNVIVFASGASPYKKDILDVIYDKNIVSSDNFNAKLFYLRGGFDINKLDWFHKVIMTLFIKKLKTQKGEKSKDIIGMINTYDKPVNFTKKSNLKEILKYVFSLK